MLKGATKTALFPMTFRAPMGERWLLKGFACLTGARSSGVKILSILPRFDLVPSLRLTNRAVILSVAEIHQMFII